MPEKSSFDAARYQELADKWVQGNLSPAERKELENWYNTGQDQPVHLPPGFAASEGVLEQQMLQAIREKAGLSVPVIPVEKRWKTIRWAAAAVFLLLSVSAAYYFIAQRNHTPENQETAAVSNKMDIQPGHNGAVLHLSNGQTIILDSAQDGTLARQGTIKVIKENGGLKYEGKADELIYNDITTARGRQWQLTLPDGTKVYLNASSSIHYPLQFTGPVREVEITGEAYFEVAHNPRQPFMVKVGNQLIEDLGTAFNVNAYTEEPVSKTTLVQGLVRVTKGDASLTVLPGQQIQTSATSGLFLEKQANVGQALAWKNGFFDFNGLDTRAIMRQVARWYGIEVRYEGQPSDALFEGRMQRNLRMSQALTGLDRCGIRCRLEGNILIVLP
ncbi:MAG TPA: FecR domain-containing protein [Puia sp.]|nr:FecR domain-containing protein [Puia sp.]